MRAQLDGDEKCKADYRLDFEQSFTREEEQENGDKLGIVHCVVERDFLVPNLFAIRMDQPMSLVAGFNTYDGQTALERNAYGSVNGEEIIVETEKERDVGTETDG